MLRGWRNQTRMLVVALLSGSIIALLVFAYLNMQRGKKPELYHQDQSPMIFQQPVGVTAAIFLDGDRGFLRQFADEATSRQVNVVIGVGDELGAILVPHQNTVYRDNNTGGGRGSTDNHQTQAGQLPFANVAETTLDQTTDYRRSIAIETLLIVLVGIGITVFLVIRLARNMAHPVRALRHSVDQIKAGNLSHRVSLGANGELGVLERSINSMAETLEGACAKEKALAEDALYLERLRAQVTLESIGDGVITTDADGNVVYINHVSEQITGWTQQQAAGRHLTEIYLINEHGDKPNSRYPIGLCLQGGQIVRNHDNHILLSKDKRKYLIEDTASPIKDRSGAIIGAVLVFRDVTELRHMARKMQFLAQHDPLTGLLNRHEFESQLQCVLASARTGETEHALCYMDLDQFKIVNDTSGHVAGDELLKQLAVHLQDRVRSNDVLARLGGDEFGIILENCSINRAINTADTLRKMVADFRFSWRNRVYEIGVSIGVVSIAAASGSITDLLSAADSACYIAKDKGRNSIHVYQEDDQDLARRHGEMQWVQRLKDALNSGSFALYCQKIMAISGESDRGNLYEILLRVKDSKLVLPDAFLPAAERYYLMPDIDRWVVQNSFSMLKDMFAEDADQTFDQSAIFSINLSGQSICDNLFLEFVLDQFQDRGIDPRRICFEITETAAIENLTRAQVFITELKKIGCWFALDDFGTGLSSFGYLKSLPVDYIKIDGAFICDLMLDPIDAAMVGAINEIGHIMGLITVAESVESKEILAMLKEINVDYVQGRGISPVVPLSTLATAGNISQHSG